MKTCNRLKLGLILIVTMVAVGCGPAGPVLAPVEGVVLLEGEPLEGAVVLFQPEGGGKPSTGLTDAAGTFTLTTLEPGDGAYVGMNSVAVTKSLPSTSSANVEEGEISDVELGSPPRYASPALSGITINVEKGMAPVTLELTWAE